MYKIFKKYDYAEQLESENDDSIENDEAYNFANLTSLKNTTKLTEH